MKSESGFSFAIASQPLRENVTNSNARSAIDLASNIDNGTNDREKYQS